MEDLKNKVEAILFSVGKKISIEKIAALCNVNDLKLIEQTLKEIKIQFNESDSSMMLLQEGTDWKLTVKDNYLPLVRNIVTDTELSKSITETLAVIAFKYPISQAELIKIRSNKAYDHVKELQEMQFIEKVKKGRTFDIKLTSKFFEYFDLPEDKVREKFQNYEEVEKVISEKEEIYEKEKEEIEKRNEELKAQLQEMQKSEDDYLGELDKMTPESLKTETGEPVEDLVNKEEKSEEPEEEQEDSLQEEPEDSEENTEPVEDSEDEEFQKENV